MTPVETKNTKSSGIEIEIQLDADDANAKLDDLFAHVTAVNELLDRTLNRLDRAAQILPPTSLEAVRAMRYGLPPTEKLYAQPCGNAENQLPAGCRSQLLPAHERKQHLRWAQ